jgi:hypothetical protein
MTIPSGRVSFDGSHGAAQHLAHRLPMRLIKNARPRTGADVRKSLMTKGNTKSGRTDDGAPATADARLAPGGRSTDGCLTGD